MDPWTEHAKWFPRTHLWKAVGEFPFHHASLDAQSLPPEQPLQPGPAGRSPSGSNLLPRVLVPAPVQRKALCPQHSRSLLPPAQPQDGWEEPEDAVPAAPSGVPVVVAPVGRGSEGAALNLRGSDPAPCLTRQTSGGCQQHKLLSTGAQSHLHPEERLSLKTAGSQVLLRSTWGRDWAPGARDTQEQLQQERRCKVCLDRYVSVVFVPCGHLVCAECAPSLQLCPICRAPILSCMCTFLS